MADSLDLNCSDEFSSYPINGEKRPGPLGQATGIINHF
jgi:hypothetical protein